MVNLHAQIDGLTARVLSAAPVPAAAHMLLEEALILIDLLTLRGHVLGRIADELALRHPEAFAGHAVDFRRGCGLLQGISRG